MGVVGGWFPNYASKIPRRGLVRKLHIEDVLAAMEGLDGEGLGRVARYAAVLLQRLEQRQAIDTQLPEPPPKKTRQPAKGHIELKMIGKHGPYAYRRVWVNGRLTSEYLGKVEKGAELSNVTAGAAGPGALQKGGGG